MRIAVLGPLTVDGAAAGLAPRDRVVLAALALRPGLVVSAEQLADALWGDRPPPSWNKVVHGCVMRLRRLLGADAIETLPQSYRLVVAGDETDAQRFERLVGRGRELLTLGEAERAAHLLGESLGLWRGRPLGDLDGWEAGRIEAARLEELRLTAEDLRLDAAVRAGRYREVLSEAQARVAEAPLREGRWALLALAQYQAGRQGEALRTLHRARTVLATELGIDPGPDLVTLEQAILRQDPSLVTPEAGPEPSEACPYLGLVPYDVSDADGFFGRDAEVEACLRRLAAGGVLAVLGPSGSGKSSLVRAGVVAALQRDGRPAVIVVPGARPMDALSALPTSGPDPVLVVDQCEHAVSLCTDPAEVARFFATLAERAGRAALIVAVRADRLGDVSAHPAFARLLERGLYLLGPMDEADLRAAVEGPAHQAGLLLEPGLVDLLVREVEGEPGALPLLSHALRQTWERREGRTLTVAGYRETGGIRGAVAQSAEAVYERVPPAQRPVLRDLLLRLVAPSGDGEPVRGRVPRRSLATDPDHERIIELLVAARLVTSDDGVVELAHEALARAWPRLRAWLDDDVEGQRILRHLAGAADAWDAMGRPDSELYRGIRLAQALEWRDRSGADLTPTEREFLGHAEQHAHHLARRQRRATQRRRTLVAGVALLLVAALTTGVLAIRQANRADNANQAADARRLAARALDAQDIDRSLLLAVEAVRMDDSPDTRASLLATLSRQPALIGSARSETVAVPNDASPVVHVSPDGEVVAAGDGFARTSFYDAHTLDLLGTLDEPPFRLEYRPDGEQLAVATTAFTSSGERDSNPVPMLLVDPTTLEEQAVQLGGMLDGQVEPWDEAWDLDYSADGRFLAISFARYDETGDFTTTVMVWDVSAPERPIQRIQPGRVWAIALRPDGRRLYIGTHDPKLSIYDVTTGDLVHTIALPPELALGTQTSVNNFDGLEIDPDGTTVAVSTFDEIVLYDATTLAEQRTFRGHTDQIQTQQFSHDGTLLASGSDDGTVLVWDVATGTRREQLSGHTGSVRGLDFSPDDASLYSVSKDSGLLVWDLDGDRRFISRRVEGAPGESLSEFAVPAPDGEAVAYFTRTTFADWGDTIRFRDVVTGRLGDAIVTTHGNWGPTWRPPDWERFATTDDDGFVRVWDWRRGQLVAERKVSAGRNASISYTNDGRHIVVAEASGAVFQIDADTLQPVGERVELETPIGEVFPGPDLHTAVVLVPHAGYAEVDLVDGRVLRRADLAFEPTFADVSPEGHRLAVGAATGEVGLVDLETGERVRPPIVAHDGMVLRVAYAADGNTVASSGEDGRVSLWDGRTGDLLVTMLPGRPNIRAAVEFLPDGHTVMITKRDGAVYSWDTRLEHWIDFACTVAGRNLTADEWREALGNRPYKETCPTG